MRKNDRISLNGFFRVQIVDKKTGKIRGDSGWAKNQITNYGLNNCICAAPIGNAASVQAAGLLLGTGDVPASSAVELDGSLSKYWSEFAYSSILSSLTARVSVSYDGTLGSVAALKNIGVFAASDGSIIAGNTFATSSLGTDQDINCSYELRYTTS